MGCGVLFTLGRLVLAVGLMIFSLGIDRSWAEDWESSINLGLTATSGNSQTANVNASLETQLKKNESITRAGASTTYGRNQGETSADKSNAFVQYSYLFTERFTGNLNFVIDRDRIADLAWRFYTGPGFGYFFVKGDSTNLIGEMGVSYFREKYERSRTDDYYALRVAERGEWKITAFSKLWETVEYSPVLNDFTKKYIVKAEAGIETSITISTHLRFLVQDAYNSTPASGNKRNDVTYIAAVGIKF